MTDLRPIPMGKRYRVILADPPWQFDLRSAKGEEKSPQAQYACMGPEDLAKFGRDIGLDFICEPHCVLVMWATFPMLPDALDLIGEWGFRYVTGGCWEKTTSSGRTAFGTGYVLRSAAELWLIAGRSADGYSACAPAVHDERNFIRAEATEHSRKPEDLHRKIERMYPGGPYLELFARRPRPGWDVYGNELGGFVEAGSPWLREVAE